MKRASLQIDFFMYDKEPLAPTWYNVAAAD